MRAFVLSCLCLAAAAPAQDDLRDVVRLTSGKELRGRVLTPFAKDELLLLQGGKRVRVPVAEVADRSTVAQSLREFLQRRRRQPDNARAGWILVEWAASRQLPEMARLQALQLVLADDGLQQAHEFLGHKRTAQGWLWPLGGRWLPRAEFEAQLDKLELRSEHFALRLDAGLAEGVAALFDLEHLYQYWFDEFGQPLQLQEVVQPMRVRTWRNAEAFPKWGFRPIPYYVPDPHGDEGRTFYQGTDPQRPRQLFFTGTQLILYHALAGSPQLADDRDRICAWLEIGLGMHAQSVLQGPPGLAAPAPPKFEDLQALQALGRTFKLTHLPHLPMYASYYLLDDAATAINWSAAAMFTAFLLDPGNDPPTRAAFLDYVRLALGERKGDSSTLFDKALGRRIEAFEAPFAQWLQKKAGY